MRPVEFDFQWDFEKGELVVTVNGISQFDPPPQEVIDSMNDQIESDIVETMNQELQLKD